MRPYRPFVALIALAILLTACASARPIAKMDAALDERDRAVLGTVGVASPCFGPNVEYRLPAKGALAGAGRGAGSAALGTAGAAMEAGRGGGYSGAVGVAILATTPLASLIGTIVGAASAEPREKVESAEAGMKEFTLYNDMNTSVNDYFITESGKIAGLPVVELAAPNEVPGGKEPGYTYLAGSGIDTVAEVAVFRIALEGPWNINPDLRLVVGSHIRLMRVTDGLQLFFRLVEYRGPEHEFCQWAADDAFLLREALDKACREIAECAVEEAFLLNEDTEYDDHAVEHRPTHWLPYRGYGYDWFYGLKPIYPEIGEMVSSLKPVLRWEPFPRPRDKAISGRVANVEYDLKVWKLGEEYRAGELVYSKEGITSTRYMLDPPLSPSTDYVWSVRAKYLLDGSQRSTLWGMQYYPSAKYGVLPRNNYYPFSTPSK